ncbi:threonine synthase [Flammeovirgaceae bacterium SG7u.111]|nr:threonine synthase [Flammeovirgaceae bacterium SG7u.132]WPO35325.1 threonine synthase [Flammeovirgaceae bacterium SG7u.111]
MKYYSTNQKAPLSDLSSAVLKGLAPDKGLYMPEQIPALPESFFKNLPNLSLAEIGTAVSEALFGEDVSKAKLQEICEDALNFDVPLVMLNDKVGSLELFHGPTCAFKDVGARFMSRMMAHFIEKREKDTYVLTATSGDTGSAVASGFFNVEGIKVVLLYPKGKVSHIQEQQLTTYGGNITAVEIDGTFDDCQRLVKDAFVDDDLNAKLTLTSANSINLARFLPQSFYYFHAFAQLGEKAKDVVFSVPSGNFGNLTAGLFAYKMGLPIKRFIAATNVNDVVPSYLNSGIFEARASVKTIANAMDVGNPSNFVRMLEIYKHSHPAMQAEITGFTQTDAQIRETMERIYKKHGYTADPHGAVGYAALEELQEEGETGIFLETAHPAKFMDVVEETLNTKVEIPERLQAFLKKEKKATPLSTEYADFKGFLEGLA